MKVILEIFLALLVIDVAQAAEPINENNGMYYQKLDHHWERLGYRVDTTTHLCFVVMSWGAAGGIAPIPCADLARRPEWTPILTWVKQ